jgi:hypothetical protein
MQAFEFQADESDGVIRIPDEILTKIKNASMKVILLLQPEQETGREEMKFDAMRVNTGGFVFNREECYER